MTDELMTERVIEVFDPEDENMDLGDDVGRTLDIHDIEFEYLDGVPDPDGAVLDENTKLECINPVWVYDEDIKKQIGSASLSCTKKALVADLFLDYHTPERLSLESGEKFYLAVVATGTRKDKTNVLERLMVHALVLTRKKHPNKKVQPVSV